MKKGFKVILVVCAAVLLSSCGTTSVIVPKAINTVNTVTFADLNLERTDYEILSTVSATAVVEAVYTSHSMKVSDPDGEFSLNYVYGKSGWVCLHKGVVRLGYLSSDYSYNPSEVMSPEDVARHLAIYRIINIAKQNGADGIIEPTVSTNVEQQGKTIVLKSTVDAKIIKLKTDE